MREDLTAARERLGLTHEQLAAEYHVTEGEVRGWEDGTIKVPRRFERDLLWRSAVREREQALAASGLPECQWVKAWAERPQSSDLDEQIERAKELERHGANCSVCQARQQYVADHLPPLPSPPLPLWINVVSRSGDLFMRLPEWSRPAVVGAAIMSAWFLFRLIFLVPQALRSPELAPELVVGFIAVALAGASGGLAYAAVRKPLRGIGRAGDYLTGVACVGVYMLALVLVAPIAFGEPVMEDPGDWPILLAVSVFFGLFIGRFWFGAAKSKRKQGTPERT